MEITPQELRSECEQYLAVYPELWVYEGDYGLPRGLLLAVGSRETDLILGYANGSLIGDSGHGYGTWQLDNRSHRIPSPFPWQLQATIASQMLHGLLGDTGGNIDQAADMYNSGRPYDWATTGGNYGTDVAARREYIAGWYPAHHPSTGPAWPGTYLMLRNPLIFEHGTGIWQSRLNQVMNSHLAVDRWFGVQTEAVTRAFQERAHVAVDGIVGPITWKAAWR